MNEHELNNDRQPLPTTPGDEASAGNAPLPPNQTPTNEIASPSNDSASIPGVAEFAQIQNGGQDQSAGSIPSDAPQSPPTEYEYSYDSRSGRYTYTDHRTQLAMQKKKNRVPLFICGTALVLILSTLMGLVGGAIGASARSNSGTTPADHHTPVEQQTIVKVNNGEIGETSLMKAATEAVNSVVVIDTFMSQAAAEAGEATGAGSGVIWTSNGYIATCNHVIDGFSIIRVTLADGTSYFADIVGTDAKTDLAVLKIAATDLPSVTIRGTDLVLAETVLAIGNPLGVLSNTVSSGILSCLTREITIEGQSMSLIQIDAAVNHGNSGGGLFDVNGSLIGIVNAKSTGDSVEGIGFAIPIATVADVCNQLIEHGYVTGRPQLGINIVAVSQSNASYIFEDEYYPNLKKYATSTYKDAWGRDRTQVIPGVYIYDISGVAGYASGSDQLEFGDRILYVGSSAISSNSDVLSALSDYNAGDTIQMTVQRGHSKTIIVNVILGQKGAK